MNEKVVLITGASSGIGKQCAHYLSEKGYKVYGTSRKAVYPPKKTSDDITLINMDVTDEASIKKAIQFIYEKEKRIDVLINNAGWGISGAIEETTIADAQDLFNTNFFGIMRTIHNILPIMREQQSGSIINISSIGGVMGLPFQGLYSATKFAVEGLTEALRMEVKPFGISVVLVEPGDFKTSFTGQRKKSSSLNKDSVYQKRAEQAMQVVEHDEQHGSSPLKIAVLIDKIISTSNPKVRYRVGSFSQKFAASLKGVISDRVLQWILLKYYKQD